MSNEAVTSGPGAETPEQAATFRKIAVRLAPLLFICYIAAYLDRTNVGFAQKQLEADLGFSDAVYGLGAGIFFIGYFLFEVPSNMLMMRIGARRTIARIMILWGIVSATMALVTEPIMFYVLRFLLGAAEAGFAPGVILYLTFYFPAIRRARMLAMFLIAVPVSGVIGGPMAGWILTGLDEAGGLYGWQWLFVLEGILPVVLGLVVLARLPDGPESAPWLDEKDRAVIARALRDDPETQGHRHPSLRTALRDWRIWALSGMYFCISAGIFLIAFWLPSILNNFGTLSALQVGWMYAIPYGAALVAMLAVSSRSDRTGERKWHLVASGLVGGVALILTTAVSRPWLSILLFAVATAGIISMMPVFWSLPTRIFAGTGNAGAVAVINSVGTLSGFVSPYLAALIKSSTGSTAGAVITIGVLLLVGTVSGLYVIDRMRTGSPRSEGTTSAVPNPG